MEGDLKEGGVDKDKRISNTKNRKKKEKQQTPRKTRGTQREKKILVGKGGQRPVKITGPKTTNGIPQRGGSEGKKV